MMLMYTGQTRAASQVLTEQKATTQTNRGLLREMRDMAFEMQKVLQDESGPSPYTAIQRAGELMHQGWLLKKGLAKGISSQAIDGHYDQARVHGAWGGKILGAGGGGFLFLLAPPDRQAEIEKALPALKRVPVRLEPWGSRIIFVG